LLPSFTSTRAAPSGAPNPFGDGCRLGSRSVRSNSVPAPAWKSSRLSPRSPPHPPKRNALLEGRLDNPQKATRWRMVLGRLEPEAPEGPETTEGWP
jgi:hypothetical protein